LARFDWTDGAAGVRNDLPLIAGYDDGGPRVSPDARQHVPAEAQRRSTEGPATLELPENLPQLPPAIDLQPAISNRHTGRESAVPRSKQTTAPPSNRHFFAGVARKIRAFLDA
jgi:hypothetical protein